MTPSPVKLGLNIRKARKAVPLKLHELSDRVECSVSLLSKFENGKANPSLRTLHRIAAALQTNIGSFFDSNEPAEVYTAASVERPILALDTLRPRASVSLERLMPNDGKRVLQGNIHIVPPGKGSDGTIRHEGEEFGYILRGRLYLTVAGKHYQLKTGDTFAFPSSLEHSYFNPGKITTRVIWICTPPTF